MERIAASPSFKARTAGVLSLLALLAAVFGEFLVRRLELAADLIAVLGMVAVTALLYDILKPVSRGLSLLAASLQPSRTHLWRSSMESSGRGPPRGIERILLFSDWLPHFQVDLPASNSDVLMALGGLGWLTFLLPPLASHLSPYNLDCGILGQESVMLWLLVMGVNVQRMNDDENDCGET